MSESAGIIELEKEVRDQRATIEDVRAENALLRQKIDLLVRRVFGRSSEALSADQLELLLGSGPEAERGKADASWAEPQEANPDHEPVDGVLDPAGVSEDDLSGSGGFLSGHGALRRS